MEDTSTLPDRREANPRVVQLVQDMVEVKATLAENTAVTNQIKEILDGFSTASKVIKFTLKWTTIIGGAIAAGAAALKGIRA